MARAELEDALADPGSSPAQLRRLLASELRRSARELELPRSGRDEPVTVAVAPGLLIVAPVGSGPDPGTPRGRVLVSLIQAGISEVAEGELAAGDHGGHLALAAEGEDADLAAIAIDETLAGVDRLRASTVVVPADVIKATDLRPLRAPVEGEGVPIAHDDPDPARRVARRILQRLNGMGKWGGYHTEFTHVARGFREDKALATAVGEALLAGGLLTEKPSVGQRHIALNPRRAGDIHRFIDEAEIPGGLTLP